MKRPLALAAAAALTLVSLAGGPSRAGAAAPAGGTIALEPQTDDGKYDPTLHLFVDAASAALTTRGFTIFDDPAHAAYWGELILSHAEVGTGLTKDPDRATVGVGAGLYVPMGTGNSHLTTLQRTRLELRIRKRDGEVVWRGAAVTVRSAGVGAGADGKVASDLIQALLARYPAEPEGVIGVP